ncbi:MAG: flagellar assembly protein FliH [Gammaproteobacteria bacterium]|nr:MAG: flagellar assembly protein FliH [Gammaproteobacteria bacterium]TND06726.1 MAG: flagellar assembly protein FliH [Gammaproteobacteria bacterium]
MSKIISAESLQSSLRSETPVVIGAARAALLGGSALQNRVEERERQAYQEGLKRGHKDGLHAGLREAAQAMAPLVAALQQPLANIDEQLEVQLVELTLAIARQLIRREIKLEPGQIVAVIRESLAALPAASPRTRIVLHPDDLALAREAIPGLDSGDAMQWQEDPSLTRGGCRVITDISAVDATVEARIAAVAARLLGGERESDGDK